MKKKNYLIRKSQYFCKQIKFASIDIGRKNFAVVFGYCDACYTKITFTSFKTINFDEIKVKKKSGVQGYYNLLDILKQYFQINNYDVFNECDMIFVEYQPPQGLRIIQEYIETTFTKKVIYIHPQQMHKYFNVNKKDYNTRKNCIEYYSTKFMKLDMYLKWNSLDRKHDVSDAICQAYYYIDVNKQITPKKRKRPTLKFERKKRLKIC